MVHQDDVMAAIQRLLKLPKRGMCIICARRTTPPGKISTRRWRNSYIWNRRLESPQFADEAEQGAQLVDGSRICDELGFQYQHPDPARMPVS